MCNQFSKFQSLNEKKIVGINVEEIIVIVELIFPRLLSLQYKIRIYSHTICATNPSPLAFSPSNFLIKLSNVKSGARYTCTTRTLLEF